VTVSDDLALGWRGYRAEVPGEQPEPFVLFFCPSCASREFRPPPEQWSRRVSWDE
jgi:hypothetical protein